MNRETFNEPVDGNFDSHRNMTVFTHRRRKENKNSLSSGHRRKLQPVKRDYEPLSTADTFTRILKTYLPNKTLKNFLINKVTRRGSAIHEEEVNICALTFSVFTVFMLLLIVISQALFSRVSTNTLLSIIFGISGLGIILVNFLYEKLGVFKKYQLPFGLREAEDIYQV